MRHLTFCAPALALMAAGCTADSLAPVSNAPPAPTATADLRNSAGLPMGTATATQIGDSVRISVRAMNLPAGPHGIHVHQTGVCAPPDFASAGAHWNPTGRKHGKSNPAGMHLGDLSNIMIGTTGQGVLEYTIRNARLMGGSPAVIDADGAAVVIHAAPDDDRTDPSGNSGARVACGTFR